MELNIHTATVGLLVLALNKCRYKKDAAKELGVSEPTLHRMINREGIKLVKGKWHYEK